MNKKKLLILGGTNISLNILSAAKEMGLEVNVADYFEDSPCKKLADKSFLTSATDVDSVAEIIRREQIDGVLMGYADVLMMPYADICGKTGLPCYLNKKSVEVTSNKQLFKQYCREFNVPVVQEYTIDDVKQGKVVYPIIVKPVDNSGSRGIYICRDSKEFDTNYALSLEFSPSKSIIIERMMNTGEATIFYYLHKGEAYLLGVADRWMYEQDSSYLKLPVGYTFPSKEISSFVEKQNEDIKTMFKSLGMTEGMVFMQAFVENGRYIIYEMGYRLTGSLEQYLMDSQYGFNHLKEIINFAVGNPVNETGIKSVDPENCCMANVTLLLKKGVISEIKGSDELLSIPWISGYHVSYEEGDEIDESKIGRLSQVGIRILIMGDNRENLLERMDMVKSLVSVVDINGCEMVVNEYSYKELCK